MNEFKGFRDRLKDFVVGELRALPEWKITDVRTLACFLQGATVLSGQFSRRGEEDYMVMAWDLLECLEQDGLLAIVSDPPAKKGSKPWNKLTEWKVVKEHAR